MHVMCIGLFLFYRIFPPVVLPHNGSRLKAASSLLLRAGFQMPLCKLFKNALL